MSVVASYMQRRLYRFTEANEQTAARHVCAVFRVPEQVDAERVRRAVDELVQRHDGLRMRFTPDGDDLLVDVRSDTADVPPAFVEVSDAAPAAVDDQLLRHFDRQAELPLRVILHRHASGTRLLLAVDHLVCDNWSLRILLEELGAGISGASLNRTPGSFFAWLRDQAAEPGDPGDVAYWAGRWTEAPDAYAIRLPFHDDTWDGASLGAPRTVEVPLGPGAAEAIRRQASRSRVSAFCYALACFCAILAPYADSDVVAVNGALSNRWSREHEATVGCLAHSASFLIDASPADPDDVFSSLTQGTQHALMQTLGHSRLALFDLIERTGLGRRLASPYGYGVYFDASFDDSDTSRLMVEGVECRDVLRRSGVSRSFSTWLVEDGDTVTLRATYEQGRFDDEGAVGLLRLLGDALLGRAWTSTTPLSWVRRTVRDVVGVPR